MATPKYYYHITQKQWPQEVTLKPRNKGWHRALTEPKTYRTCVSASIEGCLVALGSCLLWKSNLPGISIYRTLNKVIAKNTYDVADSAVTKEKWLTRPIKFIKVGFMNENLPEKLLKLSTGDLNKVPSQYKMLDLLKSKKRNYITWL